MTEHLHIACSADSRLIVDCGVMLSSLLSHNKTHQVSIHFLYDDASQPEDLATLERVVQGHGASWCPARVHPEMCTIFPRTQRFGLSAWYRVLLPTLLTNQRRILYVDADTLVRGDLAALWQVDLGEHLLAAVSQPLLPSEFSRVKQLGVSTPEAYFNSGVMLMDLERMRKDGCVDALIDFIKERRAPMPWADQDPLNAVFRGRWLQLEPKWNAMTVLFTAPYSALPYAVKHINQARQSPRIVHFIGPFKAWHQRCRNPYRREFFDVLAQTPWETRPIVGRTVRNGLIGMVPAGVEWRWQRFMAGPPIRRRIKTHLLRWSSTPENWLGAWLRDVYWTLRNAPPRRSPFRHVLEAFAYTRSNIKFLQVGSNDAVCDDPLQSYVSNREWSGILVEPVPYVFERLQQRYGNNKRLELERAAVTRTEKQATFYYLRHSSDPYLPPWYDQIGSFDLAHLMKHREYIPDIADRIVEESVRCITLKELCKKHDLDNLDLLHIDAEGHDFEILKDIQGLEFRPAVVLFEHKHFADADKNLCNELLDSLDYELIEDVHDTLAIQRSHIGWRYGRLARALRTARRIKASRSQ
nr:FkbM family methyltransferase [Oceanococcus sp. HetDA_MAG_MS8]